MTETATRQYNADAIRRYNETAAGVSGLTVTTQKDGYTVRAKSRDDAFRVARQVMVEFQGDPDSGDVTVAVAGMVVTVTVRTS